MKLVKKIAEELWNCSALRHGLFTPPDFTRICRPIIEKVLREERVFTVDQIEEYLLGWSLAGKSPEEFAIIKNSLSQLRCDQDGIEAKYNHDYFNQN